MPGGTDTVEISLRGISYTDFIGNSVRRINLRLIRECVWWLNWKFCPLTNVKRGETIVNWSLDQIKALACRSKTVTRGAARISLALIGSKNYLNAGENN